MASPFSCASFSTFKPTIVSEGRPLYYYFSVNDLSTRALLVNNSKYTRSIQSRKPIYACTNPSVHGWCVCGGGGMDGVCVFVGGGVIIYKHRIPR